MQAKGMSRRVLALHPCNLTHAISAFIIASSILTAQAVTE
jgi:hypothetical protein